MTDHDRDRHIPDWRALAMGVDPHDWDQWCAEHITLFGHAPDPDITSKTYCTHPMHGEAQRIIAAPGVEIALRWEQVGRDTLVTQDDAEIDPRFNLEKWIEKTGKPWDAEGFDGFDDAMGESGVGHDD